MKATELDPQSCAAWLSSGLQTIMRLVAGVRHAFTYHVRLIHVLDLFAQDVQACAVWLGMLFITPDQGSLAYLLRPSGSGQRRGV
jgi:hypothetical protein